MNDHSIDTDIHPVIADIIGLEPKQAAERLSHEASVTLAETLQALPHEQLLAITSHLIHANSEVDSESEAIISDVEGTVAQLMTAPNAMLGPEVTVAGALDYIVHLEPTSTITYLYVIDETQRLIGVVAMRDLLLAKPGQTLSEIMNAVPYAFKADMAVSDAVQVALKRRFRLYPVIDDDEKLIGLVYGWRIFEYVASEISSQTGSMVGLSKEERIHTPLLSSFRMRHPWLQFNLMTAFMAAFVVGFFEDTIAAIVALAVFLPVLAGQSGNTGCQALAITLRGMTLGEFQNYSVFKLLRKEIALGAMNGFFVGIVAAIAMFIYASLSGGDKPALLAMVILIAMVGACVCSGLFGVLVPISLKRFGADPAAASSIFLTTFTDIVGMGLMLLLATLMVL